MKYLLLTLLVVSCSCFSITFESALGLYGSQEFKKAYHAFDELAQLGNERAQYNIAVMYARGEYVDKDYVKALSWARLAKDSGSHYSQKVIPVFQKKLNRSQLSLADKHYESLRNVYGEAAIREKVLLKFSSESDTVKSSRPIYLASPKYPKRMARKGAYGWVDLQMVVGKDGTGRFFSIVHSPHEDFTEATLDAIKKSKISSSKVDGRPVLEFASRYRFIFQMAGSKMKSSVFQQYLDEQKSKAEQGTSQDKLLYAYQLSGLKSSLSSIDGAEDVVWQNPLIWYEKAAQDGSPLAKYELGVRALSGDQCDLDRTKSLFWLTNASDENVLDAQLALGYEYITGVRFKQDVEKGFDLIRHASDNGMAHAQVLYSWLLVTLPSKANRDVELAEKALSKIDVSKYTDMRSYYEARAAVDLAKKEWSSVKKHLKKLGKLNKKYDVSNERELALLEAYNERKAYIEKP